MTMFVSRKVAYRKVYLRSQHWAEFRRSIIAERKRCEICGSTKHLQVHHLTYARLWHERRKDVLLVCRRCHRNLHPTNPHARR